MREFAYENFTERVVISFNCPKGRLVNREGNLWMRDVLLLDILPLLLA